MRETDSRLGVPIRRWAGVHDIRWDQGTARHVVEAQSAYALPLEALVRPYAGADTLLVSLHGATRRDKYVPPRFEWMTTLEPTAAHLLCLADTTLELSESLELGWYLGSQHFDLAEQIADLIVAAGEGLGARRIIAFGSSGGGFAAAMFAHRLPSVHALAFSPQSRLTRYWAAHVNALREAAFPDWDTTERWEEAFRERVDIVHRYASAPPAGRLWYVQNLADPHHVESHYQPFRGAVGDGHGRVEYFTQDYGEGHRPPARDLLLRFLSEAAGRELVAA